LRLIVPLTKHYAVVPTLFHLLGKNEVDVTAALGFALSRAPNFAKQVLATVGIDEAPTEVRLEQRTDLLGRTDVEIQAGTWLVILEAKLGFAEPSVDQIERYARILEDKRASGQALKTAIITTTGWLDDLAERRLIPHVLGSPVRHVSWRSLAALGAHARATESRDGKGVLDDFEVFLRSVIAMTNIHSNLVYVVSLGEGGPTTGGVTWRNVADNRIYWHKMGGDRSGWPVEPPNYLGFRWHGKLQSIRHVEGHQLFRNAQDILPKAASEDWGPHICYHLGPPILPQGAASSAGIYRSGRCWVALDLLLLCDTIAEARDLTKQRRLAGARPPHRPRPTTRDSEMLVPGHPATPAVAFSDCNP
jgi:hypothetical protein